MVMVLKTLKTVGGRSHVQRTSIPEPLLHKANNLVKRKSDPALERLGLEFPSSRPA